MNIRCPLLWRETPKPFSADTRRPVSICVTSCASGRPLTLRWRLWTHQHSTNRVNNPSIAFNICNILKFHHAVMLFEVKLVCAVFVTSHQFGGAVAVNLRNPWWWNPGSAETRSKGICASIVFNFYAWQVGLIGWTSLPLCTFKIFVHRLQTSSHFCFLVTNLPVIITHLLSWTPTSHLRRLIKPTQSSRFKVPLLVMM